MSLSLFSIITLIRMNDCGRKEVKKSKSPAARSRLKKRPCDSSTGRFVQGPFTR